MNSYESSPWFWLLIIGGLTVLAALPTLVALLRRVDSLTPIILFNAIGCVTFVGWPVALVLALTMPRRAQMVTSILTER